jgi:hypothetical protein
MNDRKAKKPAAQDISSSKDASINNVASNRRKASNNRKASNSRGSKSRVSCMLGHQQPSRDVSKTRDVSIRQEDINDATHRQRG